MKLTIIIAMCAAVVGCTYAPVVLPRAGYAPVHFTVHGVR